MIRQKYPHIHLQTSSGSYVQYLSAYISNQNGQLYSRIYHNPNIQFYTLPYVIGHPKVKYSNWIRSALIHAICYCTSIDDFNQERIYIELTCLANGYSYPFVESRIAHFYDYFHLETLRYDMNQSMYDKWRQKWFDFMDIQRVLLHQLQDRHGQHKIHLLRFYYLYEYGSRCEFNQEFHKLCLKHFNQYQMLSKEKISIILFTKHLHSLNALLTQK